MSNLDHLITGDSPDTPRYNVEAMRVALAIPEAMNAGEKLLKACTTFLQGDAVGSNAYESLIESMELTARILQSSAATLRNGQKPKVCNACRK